MLTIKIPDSHGAFVPRDELVTLYASDLDYNPFYRQAVYRRDGTIELSIPQSPVLLHAKITIPGYGHMWVVADNGGQGYADGLTLDFVREAAASRIALVRGLMPDCGFTPSAKCLCKLYDAEYLMDIASREGPAAHEQRMTALAAAMWAGEQFAVERARARIARGAPRKDFLFGCGGFSYPYAGRPDIKALFDGLFNYATLPFYLAPLEPEYGKPDFSNLDALQDALERSGILTKGHPLWWAHTAGMPGWARDLRWDDGSIQREIERTVTRTVARYRGRIPYYDAINEAHDWCNAFNLSQDQQVQQTKLCCDTIHQADPQARAVINTCFVFGENVADRRTQWGPVYERNMTPLSYLQRVEELGTRYEAVGLQLYCPSRDMLELDRLYDRFARFGKPIHLTELGVPSEYMDVPPGTSEGDLYCLRYMYSGLWHEMRWSERLQADWLEWFYTISYARPEVQALTWWSMGTGYVPASGMTHEDGTGKEICFRLKALREGWGVRRQARPGTWLPAAGLCIGHTLR